MSQARRPDRRAGQTIRKVLDAGLDEMRGSSYAGLTMRAVATRAGVSPATAYTYFPSKNALVASIYLEMLKAAPVHVNVNEPTNARIRETMRDVALVGADEPELTAACASALVAGCRRSVPRSPRRHPVVSGQPLAPGGPNRSRRRWS